MSSTEIPIDRESSLTRGLRRLEETGAWLRSVDDARIDRALALGAAMLADPTSPLGKQARDALPPRTQLSPEMVHWGLSTTLETVTLASLSEAREARKRALHPHRPVPARLHAVVLASNLFTACIKPIVWSLLCQSPVALKLPSEDEGLAELFALSLLLVDEEVGQAVLPARFSRSDDALTRLLFRDADAVSIYGSDQTVQTLRTEIPVHAELLAHGHGLGAVFVGKDTPPETIDEALVGIASDVAAYDQRGCLSPHAIFVERGGPIEGEEFSERLAAALAPLARERPRAALSVGQSTQQVQWRRVSESLGALFEGDGYAVAFDDEGPLRGCPLARNIAVHTVRDERELERRLSPFGEHLKCLALTDERRGGPELTPPLSPRRAVPGFMQRPTLLDLHDGRVPWQGLARLR